MGSLQSTILGFGFFKIMQRKFKYFRDFGPYENVVLQTTAVATATMPLAGGFNASKAFLIFRIRWNYSSIENAQYHRPSWWFYCIKLVETDTLGFIFSFLWSFLCSSIKKANSKNEIFFSKS